MIADSVRVWDYGFVPICADRSFDVIAARCTESSSGARNVENILTRTLLPELSGEVLARLADGETISSVHAGIKSDGLLFFAINKP